MSKTPITQIVLDHYRTHERTTLKLHPGVNVLVGESDSGKSNVVRAVAALLENEPADRFIKHGAKAGAVAIVRGGERVVQLRKPSNDYVTEGAKKSGRKEYQSVGGGRPPIPELDDLGEITLAGEPVSLHVARQRDPALIVDDKPARVARIIGAISGLDTLYKAAHEAAKAAAKAKSDATTIDRMACEARNAHAELVKRSPCKRASNAVLFARARDESADKHAAKAAQLKTASDRLRSLGAIDPAAVADAQGKMETARRHMEKADWYEQRGDWLQVASTRLQNARANIDKLNAIRPAPGGVCPTCGQRVRGKP